LDLSRHRLDVHLLDAQGSTIQITTWTCPGFPDVSYLLGSLLPAAMVSFASYSSGLR
jgi:hypothetical protein